MLRVPCDKAFHPPSFLSLRLSSVGWCLKSWKAVTRFSRAPACPRRVLSKAFFSKLKIPAGLKRQSSNFLLQPGNASNWTHERWLPVSHLKSRVLFIIKERMKENRGHAPRTRTRVKTAILVSRFPSPPPHPSTPTHIRMHIICSSFAVRFSQRSLAAVLTLKCSSQFVWFALFHSPAPRPSPSFVLPYPNCDSSITSHTSRACRI